MVRWIPEIAAALYGNRREELLFGLQQALKLYEFYQKQLRDFEAQIEACLRRLKDKSDGRPLPPSLRQRKPEKNEVRFGARALLFRMSGADLTQIEAISETTALVILSESGIDLSGFPHEKNFVSWLGLCPLHRGSGGKIFKRTRIGVVFACPRFPSGAEQPVSELFAPFFEELEGIELDAVAWCFPPLENELIAVWGGPRQTCLPWGSALGPSSGLTGIWSRKSRGRTPDGD